MSYALFGPAGMSDDAKKACKASLQMPKFLSEYGLDCFEYQCGRGVTIGEESARALGAEALRCGIKMSLHSPYYINLSAASGEKIEKNLMYITKSAQACDFMGGDRVVVHCGGLSGQSRGDALKNTLINLEAALKELESMGLSHVRLCVETMGKINVLGDEDEVLEICRHDERLLPCIDFGHLNSRTQGGMSREGDFLRMLGKMEDALGAERARAFHGHFSKIEYSKGGEVRHLTFEDDVYGPDFDPLGRLLAERGYTPRIICESAGTQSRDALIMKNIYMKYLHHKEEN